MTIEEYTKFLDDNNVTRHKCKCCGKDIYYDNTAARIGTKKTKKGFVVLEGKHFNTIKKVGEVEYKLQVCQECLLKKYPNINNLSRTFNVMSEQTMFAFDIPEEVFKKTRQKYAMNKEHMIEKYGEEGGSKKWDDYCKRQAVTNTFEYKRKRYGMSKSDFRKYNASRSSTLENFIKRHGEEEGRKKWDDYCKRQSYTKSKEYILEKYGEEELIRILNDRKRGVINNMNNNYTNAYSRTSQEFFKRIDELIGDKYTTYYKNKNKEYIINTKNNFYFLDYYIEELNIAIEYNGDFWHANFNKYNDDYYNPVLRITAKEIREHDQKRYKILKEEHGIKTYVIWESDVKKQTVQDFLKTIPELKHLIKNNK